MKNGKQKKKMGSDYRLLVVSSRARNKVAIFNSVLPNLVLVDYNYEMTTLDELLSVWFSKKYLCGKISSASNDFILMPKRSQRSIR